MVYRNNQAISLTVRSADPRIPPKRLSAAEITNHLRDGATLVINHLDECVKRSWKWPKRWRRSAMFRGCEYVCRLGDSTLL